MGEASADVFHGFREVGGGEEQVSVIGHGDEGVEFVEALEAVVLEGFEKELCVGFGLEEAAAVGGDCSDEEGAGGGGSWRFGHGGSLLAILRKANLSFRALRCTPAFGRAEAPSARGFTARLKSGPSGRKFMLRLK